MTTAARHATVDAPPESARHARVAPVAPPRRTSQDTTIQVGALAASVVESGVKQLRMHSTELAFLAGTLVFALLLGLLGALLLMA
jgi:hypothetical protein